MSAQTELPLGPIGIVPKKNPKNKLDLQICSLVHSTRSVAGSGLPFNRANGSFESGLILSWLEQVCTIVGEHEMKRNAPLWRAYALANSDALRYAILKWNEMDPIKKRAIKNPAAWLTNRFQCAERAFAKPKKRASNG